MTRRDQLQAILDGQEPEGFESAFWKHFGADEQQGDAARRAHDNWIAQTEPVFVKVMNEALYPGADDWATVETYSTNHPRFQAQLSLVSDMVNSYRTSHHVFATVHGVTASAVHARGGGLEYEEKRSQLTAALREDEELVGSRLRVIGESLIAQVRELMRTGLDGVFLAALGGEASSFTDEEFARHIRPYDIALLDAVGQAGGLRFLHICKEGIVLDRYKSYPAEIVQVGEHINDVSLDELRAFFPGSVVIGGVDNMSPYFRGEGGSPEQLAKDAVGSVSDHTRFIIGADCSVPDDTDPALVGALSRAASSLSV